MLTVIPTAQHVIALTGKALESKWETERPEVWRCSICTYDNEGSMSACDICGVLRNPVVKSNSDKKTGNKCIIGSTI